MCTYSYGRIYAPLLRPLAGPGLDDGTSHAAGDRRRAWRLFFAFASSFARSCADGARAAAIGFPVVILLLIPLRTLVVPRMPFTAEELAILDGPTASPFVSAFVRPRWIGRRR